MHCYQEITLLPNSEINLNFLWSKVFQQIHLALVEMQDEQKRVPIGVGFPDYKIGEKYGVLGSKCRLFAADEATLVWFDAGKWLSRLSDYVHCTSIRPVPEKLAGHAIYRRLQPKINQERLARRYAKRHNLDFETALNGVVRLKQDEAETGYKTEFRYCDMSHQTVSWPFIRLKSASSGQTLCLWIKKTEVSEALIGSFSSYGLGGAASVPEF